MPLAVDDGPKRNVWRVAARIALVYAIFGSLWILLSDKILGHFVEDPQLITRIAIVKGWTYVAVTAALIYWLVRRYFRTIEYSQSLLRRSEQRYRAIVETSPDGIALTDPQGRFAFVNARMAEMLGRKAEDLVGQVLADCIDGEAHADLRRRLVDPGVGVSDRYDVHLRRPDGGEFWGIASTCPLFDARGLLIGVVTILTDITDRKRLQDSLHEAQKMEAIGQLAGGVAHDFNNLLTAIFGYTDLARHTLTPGHPALESLSGVIAAAEQAAGVSRSLLTFSRKTPTHKELVDINEAVTKAVQLLRRLLPASIQCVNDVASGASITVNADRTQLQQIVMNLAINARDAMPNGGILRISTRHIVGPTAADSPASDLAATSDRACLSVSDTGVGMSPEVLRHIFEPFFTTKPEGVGTGLGLSIIHSIVKDHGGTIQVQSEPGKGTTFNVLFPVAPAASSSMVAPAETASRGGGEMILLAEDDDQVRAITASALAAHGYEVLQVTDGEALLAAFASNRDRVRLILTDAQMPRQGGLECLRDLRARGVRTPAIVVTGSLEADVEERLDAQTLLLRKPYAVDKLIALVSRHLASA